jgi:hypothetical protein
LGPSIESLFHKHPVDRGIRADNAGNARLTGLLTNSVISSISNSGINLPVSAAACKAPRTRSVDLTVVNADFVMREICSLVWR